MSQPRIPLPALVVLVGASGSGKSTWAAANFRPEQIVSSDGLRAMVGAGDRDQSASSDAFALLEQLVSLRVKKRLTTVVDTSGLDEERRAGWLRAAKAAGIPAVLVVFDVPEELCLQRNQERTRPVPMGVIKDQVRRVRRQTPGLVEEARDQVVNETAVATPAALTEAAAAHVRQSQERVGLRFGLTISRFPVPAASQRNWLADVVSAAETAGFSSIWLMDHFVQIPQLGREWEDLLEGYTTLAYLAGLTERVTLGTLVTGITYRNPAHLAKIVATLDVLSGGRAVCGLGAAWFEREHHLYGWEFPTARHRLDLLEDALQLLPLMWGPGSPAFQGKVVSVPAAICYPRPLQEHIPLLVGGGGERRTLRLAAAYGDAVNVVGRAEAYRHKLEVLRKHCDELGRPFDAIEKTHLSRALPAAGKSRLEDVVERLRPPSTPADEFISDWGAGTINDQIGRYRLLAEAGVQHAIVGLRVIDPESVMTFGEVIKAF